MGGSLRKRGGVLFGVGSMLGRAALYAPHVTEPDPEYVNRVPQDWPMRSSVGGSIRGSLEVDVTSALLIWDRRLLR